MTLPANPWRLDWGRGPFSVSPARARLYEDVVAAPHDDRLREAHAAMAIAEGDPIGEHVRLALLNERSPAPWLDEALVDLRARYGRAIFAPWCASPFGRRLGRWLADEVPTSVLRRGLIGHFPGFDRDLPMAERLGPIESVVGSGVHAGRVGTQIRDFRSVIDESFAKNDAIAPRCVHALLGRVPSFSLASLEELSLLTSPGADPRLLTRMIEAAPKLRRLSFRVAQLDPDAVHAIAALPHLEHLGIEARGDPDWAAVVRRPGAFPALRSLHVGWGLGMRHAAELAHHRGLETLALQVNHTDELVSLLTALDGAPLTSLELAGEPDADCPLDLSAFAATRLPGLTRLASWEYDASHAAGLASLAPQLEKLTLHNVGAPGFEALLTPRSLPLLRELDVRHTAVAERDATAIARAAPHLTRLCLGDTAATQRTLTETAAALPELRHLALAGFGELDGISLIAAGVAPRLRTLAGSRWSARPDAALRSFAAAPSARSLRSVDLPAAEAWSDEVVAALVSSPHLVELGALGLPKQSSEAQRDLLLRRFGHRIALPHDASAGPLPEPDLDPWWS